MASGISRIGEGATADKSTVDNVSSYIRIGELAREFDITLRTLRFYEDKGLLQPKRQGMTRLYTERDRIRLRIVLRGRKIGFPLRDMKQILDLYSTSGTNVQQLRIFLRKSEKQMEWLEKQYAEVEEAVTELTKLITEIRARLARLTAPEPQRKTPSRITTN